MFINDNNEPYITSGSVKSFIRLTRKLLITLIQPK